MYFRQLPKKQQRQLLKDLGTVLAIHLDKHELALSLKIARDSKVSDITSTIQQSYHYLQK